MGFILCHDWKIRIFKSVSWSNVRPKHDACRDLAWLFCIVREPVPRWRKPTGGDPTWRCEVSKAIIKKPGHRICKVGDGLLDCGIVCVRRHSCQHCGP